MSNEGFIKLRRGLMQHLEQGRMNGRDLSTYVTLHFYADYKCGIAWKMSAPFIARFLNDKIRNIQESLVRLNRGEYIKRLNHRGQKTYYPVVINRFETPHGLFIRTDKMLNNKEIAFESEFKVYLKCIQNELKPNLNRIYHVAIKEVKSLITNKPKSNKEEFSPTAVY